MKGNRLDTIYHYTDINGFKNIIESKKLWLSAVNNMNDFTETRWTDDKVFKELNKISKEQGGVDKIDKMLNELYKLVQHNSPMPYICSFSKNKDSLSQWRAYADDGHGIAIGFNKKSFGLEEAPPGMTAATNHLSLGICDIVYDEVRQDTLIKETINGLLSNKNITDRNITDAAYYISKYSYVFKNPAFEEEKEVRIIHSPLISKNPNNNSIFMMGNISELKYRVSKKLLTSYFELEFSKENDISPIDEIILGPKCQISKFDIETFLSINNFGQVKIDYSKASYR